MDDATGRGNISPSGSDLQIISKTPRSPPHPLPHAMIPRIGSALVAPSPFLPHPLQFASTRLVLHSRLLRHASTSPVPARSTLAPSAQEGRANPPASTLPAPVDVPPRKGDQSLFDYALKSGKAYLQFYKTGVKNVWNNHKQARAVKERLRKSPATPAIKRDLDVSHAHFTRGEFQLLRRSRHDILRVPLFGILFLIVGEWLPVVAVFMTNLMPITCRIPKQIEKEERKHEEQRRLGRELFLASAKKHDISGFGGSEISKETHKSLHTQSVDLRAMATSVHDPEKRNSALSSYLHFAISSFNTRSMWWDRSGVIPITPWLLKLRRQLMYLAIDDALLARDGGANALRNEEVRAACSERGMDVSGKKTDALRRDLESWVQKKKAAAWLNALYSSSKDKPVVGPDAPEK